MTKFPYNSRIAVWGFNRGLSIAEVVGLYRAAVYERAGYFDYWQRSELALKHAFAKAELGSEEFHAYFNHQKRKGLFMHSVNHPHVEMLVGLAKLFALKIGAARSAIERDIAIPDAMTATIWPVYPEIGQRLGIAGNYVWRLLNKEITCLEDYVAHAYQQYSEEKILPGNLQVVESSNITTQVYRALEQS